MLTGRTPNALDDRVPVRFLFDFGSPNAYISHRLIPQIEWRSGAKFEYEPILLGGLFKLSNNRSPAVANADIPNKLSYEARELDRFVERHGLNRFRRNPFFPVNTLQLMRGAISAQQLGCFEPYVEAVFAGMWERELKMDESGTFAQALHAAGLDADALIGLSQTPEVKRRLLANTEAAHVAGAFGSPTFFVFGEMFFGKDRLRDVEEEVLRVRAGTR